MAHSNRRATTNRGELPPVFQPDNSGGPVVWRPLAESFSIVQTGRAPSGGFTVYKVVFKVWTETPERGPVIQECEVWKRYSDFHHLSKQLEAIHQRSRLDTIFPSIVKAKYFERFKESVIEERKKSAEALLFFATYYQHLAEALPLRQFLSGAKIVGRLSADPSMMADHSPNNIPFAIPSYPPLEDLDLSSNHHLNSSGEEQLAAGSSLNTHQASDHPKDGFADNDVRTGPGSGDDILEKRTSDEDEHNTKLQQQPVISCDNLDHTAVPDTSFAAGGGGANAHVTASLGESSTSESWEELHNVNGVDRTSSNVSLDNTEFEASMQEAVKGNLELEVGSFRVTEWNLAHSLKLRDSDTRPRAFNEEEEEKEEEENSDKSESENNDKEQKLSKGPVSDSSSSNPSSPTNDASTGITIIGSGVGDRDGETGCVDRGEGMEWWKEAMAEAQNISDDIDSLVEQLETDGTGRGEKHREGKGLESTHPFPLESKSSSAVVDDKSTAKKALTILSDDVIDLDQCDEVVSIERRTGGSGSEPSKSLGKTSGYSSTDSLNSAGRRSKTGSRPTSRSPSPGRRRGSPSISDKGAYVVQAGRLIKQALGYERNADYQEAFDLFKAGVDVLLNGVQSDQSKQRREVVRRKTAEYLKHAEELYQKHLAEEQEEVDRVEQLPPPCSTQKPHLLPDFKVVGFMGKVLIVESRHTSQKYVFKVLYKSLQAMAAVGKGRPKDTTNRTPKPCPHMVRLLHHYETSTHRIFLLLEYVDGGRLVDFVSSKRRQWMKLHEAVTNPPPTSSLIMPDSPKESSKNEEIPLIRESKTVSESSGSEGKGKDDKSEEEEDDIDMERMLGELASIVPPKSLPVNSSITSEGTQSGNEFDNKSEPSNSIDRLALLRKRLEESVEPEELDTADNMDSHRLGELAAATEDDEESSATINILPPTPTVPSKPGGFERHILSTDDRTQSKDSLTVEDALIPRGSLEVKGQDTPASGKVVSESMTIPKHVAEDRQVGGSPGNGSSGQGSPCFSPGSLRNTSDADTKADDWILRLEDKVCHWAAQIIVALDHLHNCGIVCRDLNPNNILITNSRSAVLTYYGRWDFVEPEIDYELAGRLYIAPELCGLLDVHPAADWWSLGAILFEILTGKSLSSCHPDGLHSHLTLRIPVKLSPEAQSLLSQLLQVNPNERLGAGLAGVEELKAHPFFSSVDWNSI